MYNYNETGGLPPDVVDGGIFSLGSWLLLLTPQSSHFYNTGYEILPTGIFSGPSTKRFLLSSNTGSGEDEDELANIAITPLGIVLCTHLSVDKLGRLAAQKKSWKGPMSVAVYLTSDQDEAEYQRFRSSYYYQANDVAFSIYREHNESIAHLYPHNILRNLAIENAQSDYVFSLDADFLPSENTYHSLTSKLKNDNSFQESLQHQTLFILPVFALPQGVVRPPVTREELVSMYHNKSAMEWHYAPGHAKIYYKTWTANNRSSPNHTLMNDFSYFIEPNLEFEPYFLCYRPGLPKYWEAFRGFVLDKTSFTHELALKGYEFRVLWDFFVVHLHHEAKGEANDRNGLANRNVDIWREEFTPYLSNKYQPKGIEERWVYPRFRDYMRVAKQQLAST
mmetsp:Transcript_8748/g.20945  ORF Transcript_8748/g.20945 Transcript_8748/m.20945 type:complete len:393 (+) Transcript_8748:15-1193(+)